MFNFLSPFTVAFLKLWSSGTVPNWPAGAALNTFSKTILVALDVCGEQSSRVSTLSENKLNSTEMHNIFACYLFATNSIIVILIDQMCLFEH